MRARRRIRHDPSPHRWLCCGSSVGRGWWHHWSWRPRRNMGVKSGPFELRVGTSPVAVPVTTGPGTGGLGDADAAAMWVNVRGRRRIRHDPNSHRLCCGSGVGCWWWPRCRRWGWWLGCWCWYRRRWRKGRACSSGNATVDFPLSLPLRFRHVVRPVVPHWSRGHDEPPQSWGEWTPRSGCRCVGARGVGLWSRGYGW